MASDQYVQTVRNAFKDFNEDFFKRFYEYRDPWRGRSLQGCHKAFNNLLRLKNVIDSSPLHAIPEEDLGQLLDAVDYFTRQLAEVDHFFRVAPDPPSSISGEVDQALVDIQRNIDGAVGQIATACQSAVQLLNYANAYESEKKISELHTKAEASTHEIERILERIRDLGAAKSVKQFEKHFNDYAVELTGEANAWLIATVALGGLTAFAVIALFVWQVTSFQHTFDTHGLILYLLSKVVLLGLMIGATVWTGRNFKAVKHQLAVTKHRAISLATFEVFPMSTSDPDVRSAILLETAKTVFGQVPSGYLEKDPAPIDPTAIGTEAMKALVGKK